MKLKDLINEVHPGKFSQDKDTLKGKDVVKVSARIQRKAEDLFKKEFGKKGTKLSILHYRFKNPKDQQNFISKLQKLGASTKDLQFENENPCWDGYKQVGMKTKNGRQVPNCVKENLNEKRMKQAVSGGKVHKFITGKNLTYKGKKYSDIEFELLGIDNREQLVKLKILAPKNLFGQEMNVPFRTIRRGPFIKTDTSK